ncbi:galactose-binding domain-containing protein [Flavobacterium algicola]|uniref:galactose-binding domain-containing protein n=1 Tax=Flavobacterium algicola TaxID=556529 RepID=UPI001EFC99A5|nr:T9SS type A sorting domain-containing protein [Flavobacterium algicola]MCG9792294.1 T9SS type A sorting domain-containing protein [Flavobacterium algicola]
MMRKNYVKVIKLFIVIVLMNFGVSNLWGQTTIYTNDMSYILGDTKQAFITNAITTEEEADNLLKGFKAMKVNGIRIPLFGRDIYGVDLNPNKPMFDYFYREALLQGFEIFANPAQGGGGARVANNMLNGEVASVKDVQAATDELIARVLEFSAEYPDCKWLNPFNEDGRATNSTWSVSQINTIYAALYNNVNGAELIGPCTWGLPAGIDMLDNTLIKNYITVAASHNLGFNHGQWSTFISKAKASNLPVWDSEVNHNDKNDTGTRLEAAIANKVDGLVLYNSWNTISLATGYLNSGAEEMMDLYLKPEAVVAVNYALNGTATQSSTNPTFNKGPELAIDDNTNGNYGSGSVTVTNSETNPWWQVDLGTDKAIGEIKVYNRTDGCCKARMSDFTVTVINSSGTTVFTKSYTTYPDPYVLIDAGGVQGKIVKIQLNVESALTLAEVQIFSYTGTLSVKEYKNAEVNMYPNPVNDKLKVISSVEDFNEYKVYSLGSGQQVLKGKIANSAQEFTIDFSKLLKGVYMLKLQGSNGVKTTKVIKN